MRVIAKATAVIFLITFLGSYLSFKVQKMQNDFISEAKWQQIFTGYSKNKGLEDQKDGKAYSLIFGEITELEEINQNVVISTIGTFLLGLFVGFKLYRREKYRRSYKSSLASNSKRKPQAYSYDRCLACNYENKPDAEVCVDCGIKLV